MKKIMFFVMLGYLFQLASVNAMQDSVDKNDPYYMSDEADLAAAKKYKQASKMYDQRQLQDKADYENYLKNKYDKSTNGYLIGYGPAYVDNNGTITTFDKWREDNDSYAEFMYGNWRQGDNDDITPSVQDKFERRISPTSIQYNVSSNNFNNTSVLAKK